MTAISTPALSADPQRPDPAFPVLNADQIARVAARGQVRAVAADTILVEAGDHVVPFFVVKSGEIQAVQMAGGVETLVVVHGPGQFTGEANMISGRRALVRVRMSQAGEVIELPRDGMLELVQTDAELGDLLIRAFILRRVALVARGLGDAVLVGSMH